MPKDAEVFCFLNILKPKGITSFDVIYKLRKRFGIKKIGHSGTLDPLASGVMQVAVGNATKLLDYLPSDKEYIATVKFGYNSTTADAEGVISEAIKPKFLALELVNAVETFKGEIFQTPPVYSAIKINGKKLCDIARNTSVENLSEIKVPERKVTLYNIEVLSFDQETYEAKIKVLCSKGTYIRSLAVDLGQKLGTGAYLTDLIRTKAGMFEIENSVEIDNVSLENDAQNPPDVLMLPKYEINCDEFEKIKNGVSIQALRLEDSDGDIYMLLFKNNLVSISLLSDNIFKCIKVFALKVVQ